MKTWSDKLKSLPENYRPINLCSVPTKIMESIIKDAVVEHLLDNGLLFPSQHGFVPRRSCVTNLLMYLEEVMTALDSGVPYDVVMVDFRRAFDVVPFDHLLLKLETHGIFGQLLPWFSDWTRGRQQRVVINGRNSNWADVTSSVVQGLVIIFIKMEQNSLSTPTTQNLDGVYDVIMTSLLSSRTWITWLVGPSETA